MPFFCLECFPSLSFKTQSLILIVQPKLTPLYQKFNGIYWIIPLPKHLYFSNFHEGFLLFPQPTAFLFPQKVKLLSRVRLFATPWTVALQAPPSMGFSRKEYWSGLPFPSPGTLKVFAYLIVVIMIWNIYCARSLQGFSYLILARSI